MSVQTVVEPMQQDQGSGPEPSAGTTPAGSGGLGAGRPSRLKSERVQEELRAMSAWELAAHEDGAIESVKSYPTPEVAALYAAFVLRFASAAGFAATVDLTGAQVCVTVYAPQINGCPGELTLPVLAFARQL